MDVVRSLIFVIWMYGLVVVLGFLGLPLLLAPRGGARWLYRIWLALVFWGLKHICGVTYRLEGMENIPEGGALIASKHQSMFETQLFWVVFDDPAIIMKKELTVLPFFGWFAVKLGNIVVDRGGGAKALKKMLRDARRWAEAGRQILVFPEGTRVPPGERVEYKPGVAGLYASMKVPCVPVAHNSGLHWPSRGFVRRRGCVTVRFLPPIPPGLPRDAFMTLLRERIESASDSLLPPHLRGA